VGIPQAEHFEIHTAAVPELRDGEVPVALN